jgi:hypothetical protein
MTRLVGPRGLSVLIFIGLVALALAVVGWFQRGNGVVQPLPNYSSVLFVIAAALVAGIAPRAAAAIASVLLLEIVIALAATGVSDTALRDLGVLGLAVCLTGSKNQRLVLRG